jgi:hypothetical protein
MSDFVNAPEPSDGDRIDWDQTLGKLLIIEPQSHEVGIETVHGLGDAIKADVHVLTGPGTAEDYAQVLIFPRVLQSQLKGQIGKKVVGRLAKGVAKPGKSAPWILDAATADDLSKASLWLASRNGAALASAPAAGGQAEAQPPF